MSKTKSAEEKTTAKIIHLDYEIRWRLEKISTENHMNLKNFIESTLTEIALNDLKKENHGR